MERRTSPLRRSILPSLYGIVGAAGLGLVGFWFFMGGWQAGEIVFTIVGGLFLIGGIMMFPAMVWRAFAGKRGGYGECPVCGTPMVADTGDAKNLLCQGCASYIDVTGDHFTTITEERLTREPYFAAPTPWPDIRVVMSSTIAFSATDYAQDKLTELMMGKKRQQGTWRQMAGRLLRVPQASHAERHAGRARNRGWRCPRQQGDAHRPRHSLLRRAQGRHQV
jgi:hypothetical protein